MSFASFFCMKSFFDGSLGREDKYKV